MSIKDFIQLVEQADIPNMQVLGQLGDGFAYIQYNGMAGVLDQQTNKMILISLKVPNSYQIVTVAGGREMTYYVGADQIGPATKKALDSITPRARSEGNPPPLPVQESYESTEQVRSIVQRMMEDARVPQKPRQGPLRPQTGAGKHKDKKKDQKQGKAKHKGKELDEGRYSSYRDDQFSLGGRMPRTDRIDRDSSSGQDAQQRMERKLKQQTIDRLLDKGYKVDALNGKSLPELIQMLREAVKKPNATTRHLRDYPVSDKDMAKPVKKPVKKKPEQGVAESIGDKRTDPAPSKEFVSNKFYVKFTPDGIEFYRKGELVHKISGDYSNPTRGDYSVAKGITTHLWQKEYKQGVAEEKQKGVDGKACWKGYKRMGTKKKGGHTVDNCVKMESISEGILSSFGLMEKSPPGFKGTVKAMKKHPELTKGKTKDGKEKNPWALAWHMKNKGYKSHKKADGSDKD